MEKTTGSLNEKMPGFSMEDIIIRPIELKDNESLAKIVRGALKEFGADKPGTVYFDESTDHLFELFEEESRSAYFVAEKDGKLLGGAGIYPTAGLPESTCELVKMYLSSEARGMGLGRKMIDHCLAIARKKKYTSVYLETMPELKKAVTVYEKFGFRYLDKPMGASGHTDCDIWMIRDL